MPAALSFGSTTWDWSRPYLVGVVNVTPDSFSDGGKHDTTRAAIAQGEALLAQGADALDIGGESTRPGAVAVSECDELQRVIPVIQALVARGAVISVDTTKASVARAALESGASIVNDVGMGDRLEDLGVVAAAFGAAYIRMHARGTPATMRERATYGDVVADVKQALAADARHLEELGVAHERILLDPGIGFAKTADQSLRLMSAVAELRSLGYALCVGPSRKSFIDASDAYAPSWWFAPSAPEARIGGTAAAIAAAVLDGAEVLRVHDVATMAQAARIAHAIRLRTKARTP